MYTGCKASSLAKTKRDGMLKYAESQRISKGHAMSLSERIQPFSKGVRESVISMYCPDSMKELIKLSVPDQDCLKRPYLGRRQHMSLARQSRFQAFSLRDFLLHLDRIEELELNAYRYTQFMAEVLTTCY